MPALSHQSVMLIVGTALTIVMLIAGSGSAVTLKVGSKPIVIAALSEEKLPAEELPAGSPSVGVPAAQSGATSSDNGDSADTDSSSEDESGSAGTVANMSPSAGTITPTPAGPPPALDLSATGLAPDLSAVSLEPEVRKAVTPSRAASIRLTEVARKELAETSTDAALRNLARAVSIDPSNPFAYYYLGRAYLSRRNYLQALTFFQRAELGFASRPDWLGETLSYEGACDEQLGRRDDAAKAYQRAVAAAPGNFRAQAGYGRLGPALAPVANFDLPPPSAGDAALPPPPEKQPLPPPANLDD